jgi:hypothetical protein
MGILWVYGKKCRMKRQLLPVMSEGFCAERPSQFKRLLKKSKNSGNRHPEPFACHSERSEKTGL